LSHTSPGGRFTPRAPEQLQRYNVTVSRARNQLWVVHSLDPETHLKAGDLRRRLIEHARDPHTLLRAMAEHGKRTDSVFETQVLKRLLAADFRVQPQWAVGSYRIDLVVEGKQRRLAVECDGERWHTPEQLHRDLERQAILERLGWVFVRIRGSVFFRAPDTAMAPVFSRLDQLGIEPLGNGDICEPDPVQPLVDKMRRAAEKIRQDWRDEQLTAGENSEYEYEKRPTRRSTGRS
jgi:very-short-patch-repair endonuclease